VPLAARRGVQPVIAALVILVTCFVLVTTLAVLGDEPYN
jgi:hypothetical protein